MNSHENVYPAEQPDKLCDGLLSRRPNFNSNRNDIKTDIRESATDKVAGPFISYKAQAGTNGRPLQTMRE